MTEGENKEARDDVERDDAEHGGVEQDAADADDDRLQPQQTRCGFFAILGAPNAGKSTLVNQMVGTKVSIVSPKVQTTRARIVGIGIHGPAQLVFIDTPGIFEPKRRLEKAMVTAAWAGADEADAIVLVVDARKGICQRTRLIIDGLKQTAARRFWR